MRILPLSEAQALPVWRRPVTLLFVMAVAMPISFSTWSVLLNNFVKDALAFDGADLGLLHTVREIPGFLAVAVIGLLWVMREQVLGLAALFLLGLATAMTAWFPTMGGILTLTLLSSIGFHYFETVNQSLQLQWLDKRRAPKVLGWLLAAGSAATLLAYGLIMASWKTFGLSYNTVYMVAGFITAGLALACLLVFPQVGSPTEQTRTFVLRRRYWLYYALQFLAGARRQIFVVFASWMMVERFGYQVHEITGLFAFTLLANMAAAPLFGWAVSRFGERRALAFEYAGLVAIFLAYGGIYLFGWGVALAATLYVLDHIFFGLALALKTYFQKIGDPADMAPTAAVAFTINHIAAVFLPVLLGVLWLVSPGAVFLLAAGLAGSSLALSLLIPRHPRPGNETIFAQRGGLATPAE